ncbi:T Cell Receptor Alpha Variable 10 [Manis pentadactyla]|nr:T Cell Receptor Alpha Variable 10 [Manis pentadactyla]
MRERGEGTAKIMPPSRRQGQLNLFLLIAAFLENEKQKEEYDPVSGIYVEGNNCTSIRRDVDPFTTSQEADAAHLANGDITEPEDIKEEVTLEMGME